MTSNCVCIFLRLYSRCCTGGIMLLPCPYRLLSIPNIFLSLRNNNEWILMKFVGGNQCHKQIKWLHFGWNSNRNKEAGYERKFESTSIGSAMMSIGSAVTSNRCSHLANEFTNSMHSPQKMPTWTEFHVNLLTSLAIFV